MNLGRDFNRLIYKDIVDWNINSVCLSRILDQVLKKSLNTILKFLVGFEEKVVKKESEAKSNKKSEKNCSFGEVYNKFYQTETS